MSAPRSLLYVPAGKPKMLRRLGELPADLLVLDLEDGVAPGEKQPARGHLREAREDGRLPPAGWHLRINPPGTSWHEADVDLARELLPDRVLLPKAEDPDAVRALAERIAGEGIGLALMIETASGVGRARELAGCHAAVGMLVYGSADLRLSMRARSGTDRAWERHALGEIVLASRMHGCVAVDAVYFQFRDPVGLEREAQIARDLGFDGKSCIHPAQVEVVHRVFAPDPREIAWARGVLRAWEEQDGSSRGVVVADGEMIEALHVEEARRVLDRAGKEAPGADGRETGPGPPS